jgi:glycosyltransferase involved in cell wall biosynthesis
MRIGVVDRGVAGWTGGGTFSRSIVASLALAAPENELFFLSNTAAAPPPSKLLPLAPVDPLPFETWFLRKLGRPDRGARMPGETEVRSALRLRDLSDPAYVAKRAGLDALVPATFIPANPGRLKTISWIADFQHLHLPQYFTQAERDYRDKWFLELARRSSRLMLSSNAALHDFQAFAPRYADKARVVRFASLLAQQAAFADPAAAVARYHLPAKFALVVNQFWGHKNHGLVVEALALLLERGLRIPMVFLGMPADYRDPENATLSRLFQQIAARGLAGQIIILGHVPRADLVDLLRGAAVVIQPSRFEGWNTTVEDAKALARPLLCSDLIVHREQAPSALGFFDCDDAQGLSALLEQWWPSLQPGPAPAAEQEQAAAGARAAALRQGEALAKLCREAVES